MPLSYQELFADEARWAMGCPGAEDAEELVGCTVEARLGNGEVVVGLLEGVCGPSLVIEDQRIPLRAVEALRAL